MIAAPEASVNSQVDVSDCQDITKHVTLSLLGVGSLISSASLLSSSTDAALDFPIALNTSESDTTKHVGGGLLWFVSQRFFC